MSRRRPWEPRERAAALLATVVVLALPSCALVVSFDEYDRGLASQARRKVTGAVEGLDPGARVSLSLNGGAAVEIGNEPFELQGGVVEGAEYVIVASQPTHSCEVDPARGVASSTDIQVIVRCRSHDTSLESLDVVKGSTPARVEPALDPVIRAYRASVPLLPTPVAASLAVKARSPSATVLVAGTPVKPLEAVTSLLGPVDVKVTSASGQQQTFLLSLDADRTYVKASNPRSSAEFGKSIALSGDTLVVGAPGDSSKATGVNGDSTDTSAANAGAVYIFTRTSGTWSQQAYIKASNTRERSQFGEALALSGDTLVVGAPGESSSATGVNGDQTATGASSSGAAYVFTRAAGTWSQQAYIKASNTHAGDAFGHSVAISNDTIVIGAYREASNAKGVNGNQADTSASNAGAAYVFARTGVAWSQQAYLKASNTAANDQFGASVALLGDTLVVGASCEMGKSTGVNGSQTNTGVKNAGAVYVFARSAGTWSQQAYVKPSNTRDEMAFGSAVALFGDTLAVGARGESSGAKGVDGDQTDTSAPGAGAVYVFTRGAGGWSQQAYVKASNTRSGIFFGTSIALDGDALLVGADGEQSRAQGINGDSNDASMAGAGAAYLFTRVAGVWGPAAYIKAPAPRAQSAFGTSVALAGTTAAVGARSESSKAAGIDGDPLDTSMPSAGAVYAY